MRSAFIGIQIGRRRPPVRSGALDRTGDLRAQSRIALPEVLEPAAHALQCGLAAQEDAADEGQQADQRAHLELYAAVSRAQFVVVEAGRLVPQASLSVERLGDGPEVLQE